MTVKTKALAAVRREQMLPPGTSVAVGLSGGADSVALLHLLLSLREELSLCEITAVHIDHGLRGEESVRDRQFVTELCERWQVPLTAHICDIAAYAAEQHIGVEEAGRAVRYEQFEAEAARIGGCVATAHTASDNAETLLLHLCRGSGLHGLSGIPPKRGCVVRPLIDCTRREIEAYCEENGLTYVTDSTNADTAYARNRIRRLVMPQLCAINPRAEDALARLIARARAWDARISAQAETALADAMLATDVYSRRVLSELDEEVLAAALRQLLCEHGRQRGSEQHIRDAIDLVRHGGRLSVPGGRLLQAAGERLYLLRQEKVAPFDVAVTPDGEWSVGGTVWRLSCVPREDYEQKLNICKNLFANACDYGKIDGCLRLRQRKAGDAFRPAGRGCEKTLKKLLNEAALPASLRDAVPILCDERGIVAVGGFGCDERVRIMADTETVLLLERLGDVKNGDDV